MIYTQIPLKYRFIPINIEDEVFQVIFMLYFRSYLKYGAELYLELVDNSQEENINDGKVIYLAQWAKDLYKNYETIEEDSDNFKVRCYKCKRKTYIARNVNPKQLGFDFWEFTCDKISEGITLYNAILEKV